MKVTLSTSGIQDRLYADKSAGWSWAGARALAEYLEELEDDTGEEMEFDGVAIRGDFDEYESAREAASQYAWDPPTTCAHCGEGCSVKDLNPQFECDCPDALDSWIEEAEESALEWLQNHTTVILFKGGIIIQAF
jgi:hypothetical protein